MECSFKNTRELNYYIILYYKYVTQYVNILVQFIHCTAVCLHATNNPGLAILSDLNLSLVATFPFQRAGMKKASRKII